MLLAAFAIGLRWVLDPWLGQRLPFITVFGVVAAAAWFGGPRPAFLATVLCFIACDYAFTDPNLPSLLVLGLYLITCSAVIWFAYVVRVAQRRAVEREDVLRVTLGSIGDAVITTDAQGAVALLNPVAETLTGWMQREAAGQRLETIFRIVNETTREPAENPIARVLSTGATAGLANHTVLIARDGTERTIDDSAAPIRDTSGRIVGCVLVFRDVTDRRRLEIDNAERYRIARMLASIVESSDDAIIAKSLDGVIQSWNVAAERIFGYTAEEAVGRNIALIIPPERVAEENHIIGRLRKGERVDHFETVRRRKDGTRVDVSLTISPIRDAGGKVIGASKIARDITARKQAEELLRENEERLRLALETGKLGVWEWDVRNDHISWTDSLHALHGVARDDFGASLDAMVALVHPDDRGRVSEAIERSLNEGAPYELEFRTVKPGGEVIWIFTSATVTRHDGRAVRMIGATMDITDRKRAEDALKTADRRKDEFLAVLAHELRNPLAPIRNAAQVLLMKASSDEDKKWSREVIGRQVHHMARLLDDLLDVSRLALNRFELRKERIELAEVIQSAVETSRPLVDAGKLELVVDIPRNPVHIHADPVRLAQVFSNLLNNAAKYTDPGGHIRLSAERGEAEIVVSVKDDGIGISADALPRIFDMFSQAKPALERSQGGLGIGLALARGLVELQGGKIEAHSAGAGTGSEFIVRFPLAAEDAIAGETPGERGTETVGPKKRLLIVDDLKDSADSLAMLLGLKGHEVHTAYNGEEAVAAAMKYEPEVILLDIGMPRVNGYDTCRLIRQKLAGHRVFLIALTGWGKEDDRTRSKEAGFDLHIVKPVDPETLSRLIEELHPAHS